MSRIFPSNQPTRRLGVAGLFFVLSLFPWVVANATQKLTNPMQLGTPIKSSSNQTHGVKASTIKGGVIQGTESDPAIYSAKLAFQSSDATLHAVHVASLDRAWTVGDRGCIFATQDGGKHWVQQSGNVTCPLYAVEMFNDTEGVIVGGSIHGQSRRSLGVVLMTSDAGRNWRTIMTPALPRLTGLQHLGNKHLIAWGDYSPEMASAIFESQDGGESWLPIPLSLGAIKASGWMSRQTGFVLDRWNRLLAVDAKSNLQPVPIPPALAQKIQSIKVNSQGIWLLGDGATIMRSLDGSQWETFTLPGTSDDHELIRISDLYADANQIIAISSFGKMVWSSQNGGKDWQAKPIPHSAGMNAIHSRDGDRVVAVGTMSRIMGSRNGGQAWWSERSAGDRLGTFAIGSLADEMPWPHLVMTSWQHGRHSAAYIVHHQDWGTHSDANPGQDACLQVAASELAMVGIEQASDLPVHYATYHRPESLAAYHKPAKVTKLVRDSTVMRRMVYRIRNLRPEVVIAGRRVAGQDAEGLCSQTALMACKLAADANYHLFSDAFGAWDEPWDVPKVYALADGKGVDIPLASDQALVNVGMRLDELMLPCQGLLSPASSAPIKKKSPASLGLMLQFEKNFSKNTKRELFGGLAVASGTTRAGTSRTAGNYQSLVANIEWRRSLESLIHAPGARWEPDASWEYQFEELIRQFAAVDADGQANLGLQLIELGQQCRSIGYWNRWRSSMWRAIRIAPNTEAGEKALLELLAFGHSRELMHWTMNEKQQDEIKLSRFQENGAVAVKSQVPHSPFANRNQGQESGVVQASFQEQEKTTSPSKQRTSTPSTEESPPELMSQRDLVAARLLPNPLVEPSVMNWAVSRMRDQNPSFMADPRVQMGMRLLEPAPSVDDQGRSSAALNAIQKGGVLDWSRRQAIAGWCQIAEQEKLLFTKQREKDSLVVTKIAERPWLDGKLEDACWAKAGVHYVSDPWGESSLKPTTLRLAYDDEYLYVGIHCPTQEPAATAPLKSKQRQHDSLEENLDHFFLRFDIDRDYASWYTFGLDRAGKPADRCCELAAWNPRWLIGKQDQDASWEVEMAIPFAELQEEPPQAGDAWGISLTRLIPNDCIQVNSRILSEHFVPQGMQLMHFQASE